MWDEFWKELRELPAKLQLPINRVDEDAFACTPVIHCFQEAYGKQGNVDVLRLM